MDITYRPAKESDLPFLLELRLQTMDRHFIAQGKHMSHEEHMQRILRRFDCAKIIIVDGQDSGMLKVHRNGTDWHLLQMQLLPELQGQGLGTRLLDQIIAEARSAGASLRLDVLKVNPARRLYHRFGFLKVGETSDSVNLQLPDK